MTDSSTNDEHCADVTADLPPTRSPAVLVRQIQLLNAEGSPGEVVVVTLSGNQRRLASIGRFPSPTDINSDELTNHLRDFHVDGGTHVHSASGSRSVVVIAYADDAAGASIASDALSSLAVDSSVSLLDRLVVWGQRWRSVICDDDACCPPAGNPIEDICTASCVEPSRVNTGDAVQSMVEAASSQRVAGPDWVKRAGAAAASEQGQEFEHAIAFEQRAQREVPWEFDSRFMLIASISEQLDDESMQPALIAALADVRLRDALLRTWVHEGSAANRERAIATLRLSLHLLTPRRAGDVLTVLAGLLWCADDATAALACAQRALELSPGYSLARLLTRALENGVPPQVWLGAVAATSMRECLVGTA